MPGPYRIQELQENGTLRLAWDNRTAPKQNGLFVILAVFWLVWAPVTVYMTYVIFLGQVTPLWFAILWFVLSWLGTVAIPIGFLSRWSSEWVVVSPTSITYGRQGILAPGPKTFPISPEKPDLELAFGYLPSRGAVQGRIDHETMITLSLFVPWFLGARKRIIIGYWLAPSIKEQIFTAIKAFVDVHKVPLAIKRYGVPIKNLPRSTN